ncbi:MAG: AMP nucleosidase [Simkaniaceae bacterium]|nr:AMP nucleosidase [Simkaniaceae bacterium]
MDDRDKKRRTGRDMYMGDDSHFTEEILEEDYARQTLERYSGSPWDKFQCNLMLTNFPTYVKQFAEDRNLEIHEGSMFTVCHSPKEEISFIDFKIGSTAAALVVDLCSFLPIKSAILLGMCAGLRRRYEIGEYLLPIASIRGEATSDFYFEKDVPALSNFLIQRAASEVLEKNERAYHVGITYTTNMRFWEFNEEFKEKLIKSKAQGLELECATLFAAAYRRQLTLGALLVISDMPLNKNGVKTKRSAKFVFDNFMDDHIEMGVKIIKRATAMQGQRKKGAYHRNIGVYKTKPKKS